MASRIAWRFRDYITSPTEEYVWQVNPKEFSTGFKKQITYQNTSAPDGKALAFEGRDEVQRISFSGTILRQDQYDQMMYWFNKRHQIEIQDDLGRKFSIYITTFEPKRERNNTFPWKHSYTCEAIILDWSEGGGGYDGFPGSSTTFGVFRRGQVGDNPAVLHQLSTATVNQSVWVAVDFEVFQNASSGTATLIDFPENFTPIKWLVSPDLLNLPRTSQVWTGGSIMHTVGDVIMIGSPVDIDGYYKYWVLWEGYFTSSGTANFEIEFDATNAAGSMSIPFSVNVAS